MITFDSLTLKAFLKENESFFVGARIQKIQQPTRRDFVFTLRNKGETRRFYVNITPQLYHLCFMNKDFEQRRNIEIPKQPPMFCMLLRKHLENAKISKVSQPKYERILELYVETYNELSEKIDLCLAIELMGKHSNIILYNCDTNVILGCAHNIGAEKSRNRELAGTLPYIYPPRQSKCDILDYYGDVFDLNESFLGFSKGFARQCEGVPLVKLKDFVKLKGLSPVIREDYSEFCLFRELLEGNHFEFVNTMIDDYFSYHQEKELLKSTKSKLLAIEKTKLKKVKNAIEKMQKQLYKERNAYKYRLYGDLIMANLYDNDDFTPFVEVLDYETGGNVKIDLDETKTLKENANRFYKLYNKQKRSKEKIMELLDEQNIEKRYLEQTIYSIEVADNFSDLLDIKSEILSVKNEKKSEKPSILELNIKDFIVFVGKNNKQNDFIVSKLAKDEDLWFHTKNCAGSHVLLKNSEKINDEIIFECAKLAKNYSTATRSSKVAVIYTKRKNLKKPPNTRLGYVTYKGEKEILVD